MFCSHNLRVPHLILLVIKNLKQVSDLCHFYSPCDQETPLLTAHVTKNSIP